MSEFARPIRLDTLGEDPRRLAIEADAAERDALTERFGLLALDRLSAEADLARDGEVVTAEGRITAAVVQACVASGAPVPATIEEPFRLRFVPDVAGEADEIELSADDCDVIPYEGGAIDLGEAAAETLALALDPFPRAADADAVLKDAGVLGEDEAGPFAALKALLGKDKS